MFNFHEIPQETTRIFLWSHKDFLVVPLGMFCGPTRNFLWSHKKPQETTRKHVQFRYFEFRIHQFRYWCSISMKFHKKPQGFSCGPTRNVLWSHKECLVVLQGISCGPTRNHKKFSCGFLWNFFKGVYMWAVAADCGRQGTQMPPSQKCWGAKRSFCPPDFSSPYRLALATELYSRTGAVSHWVTRFKL